MYPPLINFAKNDFLVIFHHKNINSPTKKVADNKLIIDKEGLPVAFPSSSKILSVRQLFASAGHVLRVETPLKVEHRSQE
jgi:hypothetical protein